MSLPSHSVCRAFRMMQDMVHNQSVDFEDALEIARVCFDVDRDVLETEFTTYDNGDQS